MTTIVRNRQDAGRIARKRGAVFEKFLTDYVFTHAVGNGLITRIDRQHPDMIPVKSAAGAGPQLFRLGKRSGADWIALLPSGSRYSYLAIEAKTTQSDALPLSALEEHQVQHLNAALKQGQGALLMVEFSQPLPEVYAIPWGAAPWKKNGSGHSMSRADLRDAWRVRGWACLKRVIAWEP